MEMIGPFLFWLHMLISTFSVENPLRGHTEAAYNKRLPLYQNKLWPQQESIFDISPLSIESSLTLAFKFTAPHNLNQSVCQHRILSKVVA